ncbi:MAG TPA: CmcI family methyltransferase [Pyrinomonadaceae bacterium]
MDKGRIIGIDIEIRPHNRKAIEEHPLSLFITLIKGSSTDPEVVNLVKRSVRKERARDRLS